MSAVGAARLRLSNTAAWITPRRIRAHAIILAFCLWGVCTIDFAIPGLSDRAGNVKFQDFLPSYLAGSLIAQHRVHDLYNQRVIADEVEKQVGQSTRVRLPFLYGPQVGLLFVPLSHLPFLAAARLWVTASLLLYFATIYFVWNSCISLRPHYKIVALCAIAFPPLFDFFVRGQSSAVVLVFFAAAYLALRSNRNWLAGIALGFLVFKPQFLVAIPLVLLLARAWKVFAGLLISAAGQLAFARFYFGPAVMRAYFDTLWHISRVIELVEPNLAPIQMHSLRSFWALLIPWPAAALGLYALSSIVIVGSAAAAWKSSTPLPLRFSALILTAVLVNPHPFVYVLLVLAP